jgi:hypothetical protein
MVTTEKVTQHYSHRVIHSVHGRVAATSSGRDHHDSLHGSLDGSLHGHGLVVVLAALPSF